MFLAICLGVGDWGSGEELQRTELGSRRSLSVFQLQAAWPALKVLLVPIHSTATEMWKALLCFSGLASRVMGYLLICLQSKPLMQDGSSKELVLLPVAVSDKGRDLPPPPCAEMLQWMREHLSLWILCFELSNRDPDIQNICFRGEQGQRWRQPPLLWQFALFTLQFWGLLIISYLHGCSFLVVFSFPPLPAVWPFHSSLPFRLCTVLFAVFST